MNTSSAHTLVIPSITSTDEHSEFCRVRTHVYLIIYHIIVHIILLKYVYHVVCVCVRHDVLMC